MNKSIRIAIEGMDGVGKTTVAKRIAKDLDFKYVEKPLQNLFDTQSIDGKKNLSEISSNLYKLDDERLKAWFFGMGNLYSFIQNSDENLIVDRHFASNYFWNGTERSKPIFENMINIIGVPDMSIVLYASVENRLKRIYERNNNDYDLKDVEKHVFGYDKIVDFLNEFNIPYIIVDTDNKTEDQVYSEVLNIVTKIIKDKDKKKLLLK